MNIGEATVLWGGINASGHCHLGTSDNIKADISHDLWLPNFLSTEGYNAAILRSSKTSHSWPLHVTVLLLHGLLSFRCFKQRRNLQCNTLVTQKLTIASLRLLITLQVAWSNPLDMMKNSAHYT